jgi:hypothetical protein
MKNHHSESRPASLCNVYSSFISTRVEHYVSLRGKLLVPPPEANIVASK